MTIKKFYKNILTVTAILISYTVMGQFTQQNFINYQGVARDASNEVMANQSITIQIDLRFGAPTASVSYAETHSVTTDISGAFSLKIGDGTTVSGDYNSLEWGILAPFASISLNGTPIGTVELHSVPFANSSGKAVNMGLNDLNDVQGAPVNGQILKFNGTNWEPSTDGGGTGGNSVWTKDGDDINYNLGNVSIGNPTLSAELAIETDDESRGLAVLNRNTASGGKVGITSILDAEGGGIKTGISSNVSKGTIKYGIRSNIIHDESFPAYGFYSDINSTPTAGGSYGIYITGEKNNYFSGEVGIGTNSPDAKLEVNGDTKLDGNLEVVQEVNRPSTGASNLLPIAYGYVTGMLNKGAFEPQPVDVSSGTGNFQVFPFQSGDGSYRNIYVIKVEGVEFENNNYVVQVTPTQGGHPLSIQVSANATTKDLQIAFTSFEDPAFPTGELVETTFMFVVYIP